MHARAPVGLASSVYHASSTYVCPILRPLWPDRDVELRKLCMYACCLFFTQYAWLVTVAPIPTLNGRPKQAAGYHLALYLPSTEAFSRAYSRAHAARLVYANPRFEGGPLEFASAMTWAEAEACGQFRVKDLRDPSTSELGLVLELEVRSPSHCSCPIHQCDLKAPMS